MTDTILATAPRRAGHAATRRLSLLALGLAAVGTAARPLRAHAGKNGKKAKKRCERQETQCRDFYVEVCDTNQSCTDHTNECCAHFGRCNAGAAIRCLSLLV